MAIRKIELMHKVFGKRENRRCGECRNLVIHRYDKTYRKCRIYGETQSAASDWAKKYVACKMFNKKWDGEPIIRLVTPCRARTNDDSVQCDGQMKIGDAYD